MYKEQIDQYFARHQDALIQDICRLVSIQSDPQPPQADMPFGPGINRALEEGLALAGEMGFHVKNWDHTVGTADINGQETALDILAHLDVVPAMGGWTVTDPYRPLVKDGKLYGRGTADDKGPAVCALYAMQAAREISGGLSKNVRMILGTDEESGSSDIKHYFQQQPHAPVTLSPDASFPVINIEKGGMKGTIKADAPADSSLPRVREITGGEKVNAIPGTATALLEGLPPEILTPLLLQAEKETGLAFSSEKKADGQLLVTASGHAGHAATPEVAANAVTGLLHLLALLPLAEGDAAQKLKALARLFPHGDWQGKAAGVAMADDESGPLTLCLTIIRYDGHALEASFDSRCPLCATKENMQQVLQDACQGAALQLVTKGMYPPHHVPRDTPFITTLLDCYTLYTGQPGECLAIGGGTYVHGIPNGVAFGAAMADTENNMHGPDEFAVVDHLIIAAKIYTEVILRLAR